MLINGSHSVQANALQAGITIEIQGIEFLEWIRHLCWKNIDNQHRKYLAILIS